MRSIAPPTRLVAVAALLVAAGGFTLVGGYATFTGSTSVAQSVDSGTITVDLGATNRLTVGATGLAAGDTVQRAVDLRTGGSVDAASATLTVSAVTSSLLDTDTTDGLHVALDRCSVPWTETEPEPGVYTYACSGTTSPVLASAPVVMTDAALAAVDLDGTTNHLRVTITLPTTAGNGFQGLSSTLEYTFAAVQRPGTDR